MLSKIESPKNSMKKPVNSTELDNGPILETIQIIGIWLDKLRFSHGTEYYVAIKKNKVELNMQIWKKNPQYIEKPKFNIQDLLWWPSG